MTLLGVLLCRRVARAHPAALLHVLRCTLVSIKLACSCRRCGGCVMRHDDPASATAQWQSPAPLCTPSTLAPLQVWPARTLHWPLACRRCCCCMVWAGLLARPAAQHNSAHLRGPGGPCMCCRGSCAPRCRHAAGGCRRGCACAAACGEVCSGAAAADGGAQLRWRSRHQAPAAAAVCAPQQCLLQLQDACSGFLWRVVPANSEV